jgi:hypothetical protein
VQCSAASRTVDRLDESGGVAGRAYSSVFVAILSLINRNSRAVRLYLIAMAILETSRLTLRPFREDDVDLLSALTANKDRDDA